jgi:hypothetical protein
MCGRATHLIPFLWDRINGANHSNSAAIQYNGQELVHKNNTFLTSAGWQLFFLLMVHLNFFFGSVV